MNFEEHHRYDPLKRIPESIHALLDIKNEIRGDSIFCPEHDLTITPRIEQCEDRIAVVGFYTASSAFDETLYECCAGTGKDIDGAIGSCVGSFVFAFMQGLAAMLNDDGGKPVRSVFNGAPQRGTVYSSDLLGLGESVDEDDNAVFSKYWDILGDGITKRLGRRSLSYVKVFASKAIGKEDAQVVGEVRINDIACKELSELVRKHAESWDVKQFASQKQFFFIKHEGEVNFPYCGEKGRELMRSKVKRALELFLSVDSDESYKALPEKLKAELDDPTLAWECYSFMPEMCCENAFPEAEFTDAVSIVYPNGEGKRVYKSALADYYRIQRMMFDMFSDGTFGDRTNDLYRLLISLSASYSGIQQLQSRGGGVKGCVTTLTFNADDDLVIR